ncbi:hypothetical protein EL22_25250 [Halostagnicola sp. A56]|uniref:hypothetical protein n=1 Tax=Halostagnicola sp. A56 TaxID=1495067 RepID=UPI0004A14D6D|nr:hypothetical protein [Halostagnicola sp. A56]KDE56679.1 hypothetical protein EL22_25250 [Halostagnicola sp. A56]
MKLMPLLTLGLAFALAFSMVTLSGVGPQLGHSPDSGIQGEFNDTASDAESGQFDPDEGGDSLLGSTVAALSMVQSALGVVVFLPSTLSSIGAPGWFASLAGRVIQIVIALGLAQIVRGFEIL